MKNNVISFNRDELPDDLMTFKQFSQKHNTSVSYLYKLCYKGLFKRHKLGKWKISEKETLKAIKEAG